MNDIDRDTGMFINGMTSFVAHLISLGWCEDGLHDAVSRFIDEGTLDACISISKVTGGAPPSDGMTVAMFKTMPLGVFHEN